MRCSGRFSVQLAVIVLQLCLLAVRANAQANPEAEALAAFDAGCLHDDDPFDKALALAGSKSWPVAPERIRDVLVRKGEGAAWQVSETPFIALHANITAGCGIMLKPADEAAFKSLIGAMEGAKLLSGDSFETSWSQWYRFERGGVKGILLAGLLDATETKSAYLRFMPADAVLTGDKAKEFLLADPARFEELRASLSKK